MNNRSGMDAKLSWVLNLSEPDGDRHIYFNPPPSVRMRYPAIKYSLNNINRNFANNDGYQTLSSYEVTLIDEDPDSIYVDKILQIPYCSFNRFYIADDLNHWVFTIYNH
jgi:hypothetical protein